MKNKITICLMLMVISCFCFGQKQTISCPKPNPAQIKSQQMKIYLLGGIVSSITKKEIDFSKKYNVTFQDFGCLAPTNLDYYDALNCKTFDLLNIQFGPKWQEEIKPTTLGLAKWKENNK
jgi:hypothetical protein